MIKSLGKIKGVRRFLSISYIFSILLVSFLLLIAACSKPAGLIGVVVQPEDSRLPVVYTDTTEILVYSIPEDSVRSDELSVNVIGANYDPVFGQTIGGVYLQFNLEEAKHRFGPNPVMDSMILFLLYQDAYGDTTTPLTFRAYEMEEGIERDSAYYSNLELPLKSTDVSNTNFIPGPSDSLIFGGDTLPPMLKVRMDFNDELANKLLMAPDYAMDSNAGFHEYFKGVYVVADPVEYGGALLSFDILSNFSEMILYYHNDTVDSLSFDYMITPLNATINTYEHIFDNSDFFFRQQVVEGDTTLGQENFYLQGGSGVASIIKFPNIKNWNKNTVLNEAKLILNVSEEEPLWGAPQQLSMAQIEDDGNFGYLPDQIEELEIYFGGGYKVSTNSYTFRITRYLQSLITDSEKNDNGLYLIPTGASIFPNRVVFDGSNPSLEGARSIRLEIIYTDLN
ncbi:MAG: DUF4270 family protein [bacterium]